MIFIECPVCFGDGMIEDEIEDDDNEYGASECPECYGTGRVQLPNDQWLSFLDELHKAVELAFKIREGEEKR